MDGTTSGMKTKHTLNKDRFLEEMQARGWKFDDVYGWLAPQVKGLTKRMMEQHWIESILGAVECPHDRSED
jgi:hypothetical protein